jgi:hypothetical protein
MNFPKKKATYAAKRDDPNGAVIVIPHYVLNSASYKTLSGNAVRLLFDIGVQYNGKDNNGSLLASWRYMHEKRGWTSASSLRSALTELEERQLIIKTVQGHRPNKASWFAIGWAALGNMNKLEIKSQSFPRGAYAHWSPSSESKLRRKMPIPIRITNKRPNHQDTSTPSKKLVALDRKEDCQHA